MNNNLNIDKNLSDSIKNFNLCKNEFIASEHKGPSNTIFSYAFGNKKNYSDKNETNIKGDEKELIKQFSELREINNLENRNLIKKLNIEEQIKKNSFEHIYKMNKLNNLPETKEFLYDIEKVKKKIKIGTVAFVFYSVYAIMEFYDSKTKIYENVRSLINDNPSKMNLFNYKRNLILGVPLIAFILYQNRQYKNIERDYKDTIRKKYYDEESGLENFNLAMNFKY
jgi:hypothetical protein